MVHGQMEYSSWQAAQCKKKNLMTFWKVALIFEHVHFQAHVSMCIVLITSLQEIWASQEFLTVHRGKRLLPY